MNHPASPTPFSRRNFLLRGVLAGPTAAVVGSGATNAAVRGDANPFAYSVREFERTDPALVGYREVRRFRLPWSEPQRLSRTPNGHLMVAARGALGEVDPEGNTVRQIPVQGVARCVEVAEDGTIYAGFRDHLEVFAADGRRLATWEAVGGRSWFSGIAVTSDTVFAANAGQRVILRYDRSGKLMGRLGERDRAREIPGFVLPSPYLDVEWHADGLLRVNNPGRHRVELYTPEGDLELTWGRPTAAIEGFGGCCNPINLAVLADGRVVTCEKGLPRVKIYSAVGDFECVVAGAETFPENGRVGAGDGLNDAVRASLDAVVGRDGRIAILDTVTAHVHLMEPKTAEPG